MGKAIDCSPQTAEEKAYYWRNASERMRQSVILAELERRDSH